MNHNFSKGDIGKIIANGDGAKAIKHSYFIGCEVEVLETIGTDQLRIKRTGKWYKGIFALAQTVEAKHLQMVVPNEFGEDDYASEILMHQ